MHPTSVGSSLRFFARYLLPLLIAAAFWYLPLAFVQGVDPAAEWLGRMDGPMLVRWVHLLALPANCLVLLVGLLKAEESGDLLGAKMVVNLFATVLFSIFLEHAFRALPPIGEMHPLLAILPIVGCLAAALSLRGHIRVVLRICLTLQQKAQP